MLQKVLNLTSVLVSPCQDVRKQRWRTDRKQDAGTSRALFCTYCNIPVQTFAQQTPIALFSKSFLKITQQKIDRELLTEVLSCHEILKYRYTPSDQLYHHGISLSVTCCRPDVAASLCCSDSPGHLEEKVSQLEAMLRKLQDDLQKVLWHEWMLNKCEKKTGKKHF